MKRLFILALFIVCGFAPPKLVKTKLPEGITVLLPSDWRPMDDLDFNERYPSVRAPIAAYTNPDRLVDFSVNISATQWPDADVEMAKKFFKATIMNTFDKVTMINEGIRDSHGKKFVYFEFNSRVNGTNAQEGLNDPVLRYSYIQYMIEPGKTRVFSFNCPQRLQQEWQETARKMMVSVKV